MTETDVLPPAQARHIDHVCDCFESSWKAWQSGERPCVADFLGATREPERSNLLRELIQLEIYYRSRRGEDWRVEEFRARFPELDADWLAGLAGGAVWSAPASPPAETATPGSREPVCRTPAPAGGPVLAGYELLETIRTGMAVVYKARQLRPHRLVAIKTIPPRDGAMPADLQRFLHNEAERVARLDHPHIVPIYEVGASAGQPYFSMKWIDGGSLARAVAGGKWPTGSKDSARRAAGLTAKVARAVHYAHQRGVLHCDLKPANILLDADGRPYVSDFGLARPLDEATSPWSGEITGTPSYMAPEQAGGRKGLTTRVDVYGLGAVLYELLTGRPPFRGESVADTLRQAAEGELAPPRTLNPAASGDLEAICLKCLEKNPDRRYGSAEALAEDLERWLAGEPVLARRSGAGERAVKWAKRRPAAAALAGLSLAVLASLFGLVVWQWQTAVADRQAAEARKKQAKVNDAALLTAVVSEAQNLYSAEVVDRVKGVKGVEVSHDYELREGTIPLPPTLTMILARRISEEHSGTVRLYSDLPFRSRKDRTPPDPFETEALSALRQKPEQPFYRFEDWQGRPSLRYASAEVMRSQCLDCHNKHQDSPKRDWKEGDVRGVLEVILPLD